MSAVFLKILNMSIAYGWVIIAVMVLRLLLRRVFPRRIWCWFWGMTAIRLLLPFSVESAYSLIPSTQTIQTAVYAHRPYIETGISVVDRSVNGILGDRYYEGVTIETGNFSRILNALSIIWIIGIVVLAFYGLISYLRLRKQVAVCMKVQDLVYQCDDISVPFILGVVHPKIYLPSTLSEQQAEYVIAHETAHLARHDHWWKCLGLVVLAVHWFNPLVWIAFILFCRDIEWACDKRVIASLSASERKNYAQVLAECSVRGSMANGFRLAFGEVHVKDRLKAILRYKKPVFAVIVVAVILSVAFALTFLTSPLSEHPVLEGHQWGFSLIQRNSDGQVIVCSEGEKTFYENAQVSDFTLQEDNGTLLLTQPQTGQSWSMSYWKERSGPNGSIYSITCGEKTGYAGVGITSYQDGGSEYTLYIVIGDYSIKFTEWIRISSVGGVTSPESTQITSAVSAEA